MALDGTNTNLTQAPNTETIPGYVAPPATDTNAKKAVTELELGKMTMWAWGARKASLSSTHCPEYIDIVSADYNVVYKTGTVNGNDIEEDYAIITTPSPGSNDKLLKRESVTKTSGKYTFNIGHFLSTDPGKYYLKIFLAKDSTSTTSICDLSDDLVKNLDKDEWKDFSVECPLVNLINSSSTSIPRDAYVCIQLHDANWTYPRDVYAGVVKWDGSKWVDVKATEQIGNSVKSVTHNLGIKWRDLIGYRYRIIFQLKHRSSDS